MTTAPPWVAPELGIDGVEIRVTTRAGGVSLPPWDALNLGDHVGDNPEHVAENRRRLQDTLPVNHISWLRQVHGTHSVRAVDKQVSTADA